MDRRPISLTPPWRGIGPLISLFGKALPKGIALSLVVFESKPSFYAIILMYIKSEVADSIWFKKRVEDRSYSEFSQSHKPNSLIACNTATSMKGLVGNAESFVN